MGTNGTVASLLHRAITSAFMTRTPKTFVDIHDYFNQDPVQLHAPLCAKPLDASQWNASDLVKANANCFPRAQCPRQGLMI